MGLFQTPTYKTYSSLSQAPSGIKPSQASDDYGPSPDGRRRFGSISRAIVEVLTEVQTDLPVRDVWAAVEQLLGEPVSRHSVKSYLHRGTYDLKIFERVRHVRYRLS